MKKFIVETAGVMIGVTIASLIWGVWMELEKPECVDPAIPMLTSIADYEWDCAVVESPR